jgi:hypothetical protein
MRQRFDAEDRLMLWFDFNNHDSKRVMRNMSDFMERVASRFAITTDGSSKALKALSSKQKRS